MVQFPAHMLPDGVDTDDVPTGIRVTADQTGADGVLAKIVHGECFGRHIEWSDEASETTVTVSTDPTSGLPVLSYPLGKTGEHTAVYRGLEADGVTWWRYAHEVDANEYREHCLRIVALV